MAKAERHRQSIPARSPRSSDDEKRVSAPIEQASRGDLIARRAYELYEERGREDGHDWDDWFRAERETQHLQPASPTERAPMESERESRATGGQQGKSADSFASV